MTLKKQYGASAITMLVILVLAFSGFVTLLKVVPVYTDDMAVETIFTNIQEELSDKDRPSRSALFDKIQKRMDINGVSNLMEYVEVGGKGSTIIIEMNYERRVPLVANLELVATFNHYIDLSE
ncbi:DUF4845 domain-containing protein [Bermanella marisrubri]|uniref:DUF4845 domain-containing protein n=1 Tax=Bermanella marisrubri TaxID=207949 RepID=Q1MXP9_9GAMM|nr:DUF4845 domain-containing protein [Bermanella marisrubri]EAT10735.1 hypothetical protein RED65_03810 [Oceanobacter sp. RED65] [Bermanella marisrubri]QIZ83596.1 DUF4845 domain-containing protein [Bermanella marisrubri]